MDFELGVKKHMSWDWDLKNRSRVEEGADTNEPYVDLISYHIISCVACVLYAYEMVDTSSVSYHRIGEL